jgi:hypothetical protein
MGAKSLSFGQACPWLQAMAHRRRSSLTGDRRVHLRVTLHRQDTAESRKVHRAATSRCEARRQDASVVRSNERTRRGGPAARPTRPGRCRPPRRPRAPSRRARRPSDRCRRAWRRGGGGRRHRAHRRRRRPWGSSGTRGWCGPIGLAVAEPSPERRPMLAGVHHRGGGPVLHCATWHVMSTSSGTGGAPGTNVRRRSAAPSSCSQVPSPSSPDRCSTRRPRPCRGAAAAGTSRPSPSIGGR